MEWNFSLAARSTPPLAAQGSHWLVSASPRPMRALHFCLHLKLSKNQESHIERISFHVFSPRVQHIALNF